MTRIACHGARNHYIEHHMSRYASILHNPEYRAAMRLSQSDVDRELDSLEHKRRILQQYSVAVKKFKDADLDPNDAIVLKL